MDMRQEVLIDMRTASLSLPDHGGTLAPRFRIIHPCPREDPMTSLNHYLSEKRSAVLAREALIDAGNAGPTQLAARVTAEGRSGVRRIRIRDHQVISDSPPDFAGYNLGPSSPELQLGVLGSCVTHIFLIQAAHRQVAVDSLEVEVSGRIDPRGGRPGHEDIPIWPHDIGYVVHLESPAPAADVQALFEAVEATCPILNLLKNPQQIRAELRHRQTEAADTPGDGHGAENVIA